MVADTYYNPLDCDGHHHCSECGELELDCFLTLDDGRDVCEYCMESPNNKEKVMAKGGEGWRGMIAGTEKRQGNTTCK